MCTWKCGTCGKGFKSTTVLADHTVTHQTYIKKEHSETATTKSHGTFCVACSTNFNSKAEMRKHFQEQHQKNKVKCTHCEKTFSSKYTFNQHITVVHEGNRYVCTEDNCGQEFKHKDQLDVHIMQHKGEYKFTCSICDKGFFQKHHYTGHHNSHSDEQPNWCPKCGKQFLYSHDVYKHLDKCSVDEKEFECTLGDCAGKKFFNTEAEFNRHMKSYHRMGDVYVCETCGWKTYYHQSYKVHVKTHEETD